MGFSHVFWIDEAPVRAALAADAPTLTASLGESVLRVVVRDSNGDFPTVPFPSDGPVHSAGVVHSTSALWFVWTGMELVMFPHRDSAQPRFRDEGRDPAWLECIRQIDSLLPKERLIKNREDEESDMAIASYMTGRRDMASFRINDAVASIYWLDEDWSRKHKRVKPPDWPCREVGAEVLHMIQWQGEVGHPSGFCLPCRKAASIVDPQFAAFLWDGCSLRHVSDVDLP